MKKGGVHVKRKSALPLGEECCGAVRECFRAPHGKLYLRLQELVPESESVRLAASTSPKTMASSIEILDAILQATDFSNGYPKSLFGNRPNLA
jgi:hypothetical protein